MVELRSVLFVLSFIFFFIFFYFSKSFSQFLYLPFFLFSFLFFLPLSWCLAFLSSLSKFLHLSVHIVGDWLNPFSLISNEIYSHKCLFDFVLDPCLSSLLGILDFDFDFMVLVVVTAIAKNHLPVLVVRVGVSVRVRLRSMVRWQGVAVGAIMWVSK